MNKDRAIKELMFLVGEDDYNDLTHEQQEELIQIYVHHVPFSAEETYLLMQQHGGSFSNADQLWLLIPTLESYRATYGRPQGKIPRELRIKYLNAN